MNDYQKLLNACKEYRAKVDELLEANNELSERLSTIPDEVWSKADLVKQIHQAYAERDELQKENTKLKDALKEEKIDRSLDGWNEAAIINDLKRENAALNETTKKHVAAYYELMAENAALRDELAAIKRQVINTGMIEYFTDDQLRSMVKTHGLDKMWVETVLNNSKKEAQP